VLGVVLIHAADQFPASAIDHYAFSGQRGVQLFFMVSAFTLFLSYDNRREEHHPTRNFFLRRLFRIVPMYYVATALACVLTPELAGPPSHVVLSLLFLHGFSQATINHGALAGWSVADEALFYVCLPLLFRRIRTLESAIRWLFISAPCMFLLGQTLSHFYPSQYGYFSFSFFPIEIPVFLMGIVAYFLWKEYLVGRDGALAVRTPKLLSLLLLGLTFTVFFLGLPVFYPNDTLYLSSVACALLLVALSLYAWPFLVNRFTIFLGKISFSLYLLHYHVCRAVSRLLELDPYRYPGHVHRPLFQVSALFAATVLASIPVATLTWLFIEEPGIRLGRRLIAHLEGRALSKKQAELVPPLKAVTGLGNSPDAQF
jgi:peptidoglycan/LPS O-acetylase OafA/YrhL